MNIKANFNNLVSGFGQSVRFFGPFTFALQTLLAQSVHSSVLVRSPLTQEARLQVLLQKQRLGNQSFVEYWRTKNPSPEKVEQLQKVFEEAQRAMLADGPLAAKAKYLNVVDLMLSADWKNAEREIIFQSLLRLASIETNLSERLALFEKALSLDSELKVDRELFSPALEKEYSTFRVSQQKSYRQWRPNVPPDVQIFINGKRVEPSKILLSSGTRRITFVSNSYLPHTVLMEPKTLVSTDIQLEPIVIGSCGAANWKFKDASVPDIVAVFDNCVEDYEGRKISLDEPIETKLPKATPTSLQLPGELPSQPIYKKPLFWVVTGAILVGALVVWQKNNQSSQSTTPTHSEGL